MPLSRYHSTSGNCYSEAFPVQRRDDRPQGRRDDNMKTDYYVGSRNVVSLNGGNLHNYLGDKEKALVMFYNSDKCHAYGVDKEFAQVADSTQNDSFGFGAIDCASNGPVCSREGASQTPMFKLYSNGHEVSTIRDVSHLTSDQMMLLMVMTPDLHHSRGNLRNLIPIQR